jgi:hypothetical protein
MKKQFVLQISQNEVHLPVLQKHLSKHGLLLHDSSNQTWIFKNEKSFWEGWKLNPLKWGASLEMKWLEHSVVIQLEVNTSHGMSTKAAMNAWKVLLQQIKKLCLHGGWNETELQNAIQQAKSSVLYRLIFQMLGLFFVFSAISYKFDFFEWNFLMKVVIILVISLTFQFLSCKEIEGEIV